MTEARPYSHNRPPRDHNARKSLQYAAWVFDSVRKIAAAVPRAEGFGSRFAQSTALCMLATKAINNAVAYSTTRNVSAASPRLRLLSRVPVDRPTGLVRVGLLQPHELEADGG